MSLSTCRRIKILLAGGGTGGHIYPGIVLAKEFLQRGNIECLMLITDRAMDEEILKRAGLPYGKLPLVGMNWGWTKRGIGDVTRLFRSAKEAWRFISSFRPDFIIGLGAYASFPVIITGRIRGITTFIQEQNLNPGRANLFLARWVDGIFTSFKESEGCC